MPIAPVVLSIDPGHGGGPNSSRSVIQAWKCHDKKYYLIDEFCEQCDFRELLRQFWSFVRRYRPSVALIEKTADGPALYSEVRRKAKFDIQLIIPRRDSKAVRFNDHLPTIRRKKIYLPELAVWRDAFVTEMVEFSGEFDDRVDAMTQYLDYMALNPSIPPAPKRDLGIAVVSRRRPS